MTSTVFRWDVESFLRATDAGVFPVRVELVDGEVWPVLLGDWHGEATARAVAALAGHGTVSTSTLATGGSLPDPDVWLRSAGAEPVGVVSARLSRWDRADVVLVVEVADETVREDLTVKARLYGAAGYPRYWVVTRDVVHEHTDPTPDGYATVRVVEGGGTLRLPGGSAVRASALLGT